MSKLFVKWVAGFDYNNKVVVASCRCRETAKLIIVEQPNGDEERRARQLIDYKTRLDKEQAGLLLHDHANEALEALRQRQGEVVKRAMEMIEKAQARIHLIQQYAR